ncbi:MAG: hypothetical protein WBP45_14935 [Daejeonella sp.]
MNNYILKREELINKSLDLTDKVYYDDLEMADGMLSLTATLELAEPNEEFVNDLLAFIEFAETKKLDDHSVLTTVFHDLGEFRRNREKNWFSPRSSGYSQKNSNLRTLKK